MKNIKKILLWSGISFLLILAFLIAAPFLFKGKIIRLAKQQANENLNAVVNFSEDIHISFFKNFPKLTIGIDNLTIAGLDSFQFDTLASIGLLQIDVNVMSVISGDKVEIEHIYLENPNILLKVLPSGKANWDIAKPDSTAESTEDSSASTFNLQLKSLVVENGHLVYDDKSLGFYTKLQSFNHKLTGDFTLDNFIMSTSTDAEALTLGYGGIHYLEKVKANIQADMEMNMADMKFSFKENLIKLNNLELGADGFIKLNENDMDFDLKYAAKKTDFSNFISIVPGVFTEAFSKAKTSGKLGFDGYVKGKMTETDLPGFALHLDVDNGYLQYPDLPLPLKDVQIDLSINNPGGSEDNTIIHLKDFHINLAGDPFDAKLLLKTPVSDPFADGMVKGKLDLAGITKIFPLEDGTKLAGIINSDLSFKGNYSTIESGNLENFNAQGQLLATDIIYSNKEMPDGVLVSKAHFNFNPKFVAMPAFDGKIGNSDFSSSGELSNFFGYAFRDEILKGNLQFRSNYFNSNQFLSTEPDAVKDAPTAADSLPLQAIEIPSNIDFRLNAAIGKLIYDNLTLENMAGIVEVKDAKLIFDNVKTDILGGNILMTGEYNSLNPKFPFTDLNLNVNHLNISESFKYFDIIKKFGPIAEHTEGFFNAKLDLNTNLNSDLTPAYPTLTGLGSISLSDATVKKSGILNELAEKLNIAELKNLNLKNLAINFKIADGKMFTDTFFLPAGKNKKIKIAGYTALDQTIAYTGRMSLPRSEFGAGNTTLNNVLKQARDKGVNVDVSEMLDLDLIIGGTFTKPEIKVSLKDLKEKLVDNVKDQLKNQLNDKKDALLNDAQKKKEEARQKAIDSVNAVKAKAQQELEAKKKEAEEKARLEKERLEEEARKKAEEEKKKLQDKAKDKLKGLGKP